MSKLLAMMMKKQEYMDLTVVGSPTISNGVVSDFSANDYIADNNTFDISSNFEICVKINSWENISAVQNFFSLRGSVNLNLRFDTTGTTINGVYGSSISKWNNIATNLTVGLPTTIRVSGNGINITITTIQNGISQSSNKTISELDLSGNYTIYYGRGGSAAPFTSGYIDMYSSYKKLGNTKYKFQFTMPLTVLGSPTIVDGVISGLTDKQDTVQTINSINVGDNAWEFQMCLLHPIKKATGIFRVNNSNNTRTTMTSGNGFNIYLNYPQYSTSITGLSSQWDNAINNSAPQIFLKISCSGKNENNEYPIIIGISTDGINWKTYSENYPVTLAVGEIMFASSYTSYATGTNVGYSLDIPKCHFIINGTKYIFTLPQS